MSSLGECVWFATQECMTVKKKDRQFIYVFDDFAGEAFQHIVSTGNRLEFDAFSIRIIFFAVQCAFKLKYSS